MAGETMAEFEVIATDDEMMEDEAEMLTLFLVVDDMRRRGGRAQRDPILGGRCVGVFRAYQ